MSTTTRIWPPTLATAPHGARLVTDSVDVDLASNASFIDRVPHHAFDELRRNGGVAWHAEPPVALRRSVRSKSLNMGSRRGA